MRSGCDAFDERFRMCNKFLNMQLGENDYTQQSPSLWATSNDVQRQSKLIHSGAGLAKKAF